MILKNKRNSVLAIDKKGLKEQKIRQIIESKIIKSFADSAGVLKRFVTVVSLVAVCTAILGAPQCALQEKDKNNWKCDK